MSGLSGKSLKSEHKISVRFSEVDSMGIVWHGHYVQYLEESREQFGLTHQIDYLTIAAHGFQVPVVDFNIKYRKSLKYGDQANIVCTYIDTHAAKIIFKYEIFNTADNQLCATAETVQVFINLKGELQLTYPPFFIDWKRRVGLI
ncbi:MAG: acyl-CoA thioesterase [Saprospiraceae bacterium]|nr:acyl-CoA thioesterase [Saprospiraceae bacterium]